MKHIVKKQILQLKLDRRLDAFKIQHTASIQYWDKVVKTIEKIFDEISNEEETILIDHLEIDLGIINNKDFDNGKWITEIAVKISEQIKGSSSLNGKAIIVQRFPKQIGVYKQWLNYMKQGYLPWNAQKIDEPFLENVLQALASDYQSISELRITIQQNSFALKRMVQQHSENFLLHLVEILTAGNQDKLPVIVNELSILFFAMSKPGKQPVTEQKKQHKLNLWERVLWIASLEERKITPLRIAEYILLEFKVQVVKYIQSSPSILLKLKLIKPVLENVKKPSPEKLISELTKDSTKKKKITAEKIEKAGKMEETGVNELTKNNEPVNETKPKNELNKTGRAITAIIEMPCLEVKDEDAKTVIEPLPDIQVRESIEKINETIDSEGIYVQQAGVVLLHPFLKTFFEKLKILKGSKFIHAKAHQKALYLLHYLATGKTKAQEHELIIAKVLCNYPVDMPVESNIIISKKEKNESKKLLNAVIDNWDKLKNSSPIAIREGFLQRNGKLYSKNGSPYLLVETASIDLLLDFLPWNLSMIKLPWMNEMLRVEWR